VSQERRISIGPLIGIVGALLLLVSLFLDWYEGISGFTVFEVLDLLLAGLAIAAIVALANALGARLKGAGALDGRTALPLAALAFLVVVSQLLNDPPAVAGGDRDPDLGIWLALAGSLLLLAGALLSVARISLALDLERRDGSGGREERAPASSHDAPTVAAPATGTAEPPRERGPGPGPVDPGPRA
jgi:hypothetical protein